jgi:CheY-like chemotaxis protein
VELHKGKLRAKSQGEGKGSVFVVKIPVASPHADDGSAPNAKSPGRCRAAEAKTLSSDTPSGGTVLLVDDDSDVLDALANTFAGEEIDAFTATSAERARHILKTNHVDVIFSDISMPDESGYEFIASIRRQDVTVPAVALTAYVRNEDRLRALEPGFDDHIGKPVNPRDLLAVFARLSSRARYRSWPRKKTRVPILT